MLFGFFKKKEAHSASQSSGTPYDGNEPFGFSKLNPIVVTNIPASYFYLYGLRNELGSINWNRCGSCRGTFNEILDIWEASVSLKDGSIKKYTLYVNCYGTASSSRVPEGFFMAKQ